MPSNIIRNQQFFSTDEDPVFSAIGLEIGGYVQPLRQEYICF